jgi:HAE1 family hydrophobic/amphiphilic exporter-1
VAERTEVKSPLDAIYKGCLIRVAPHHDDYYGSAHGYLAYRARLRRRSSAPRSLGLAAVGGQLVSQLITLYITPVYYTCLDSF